MTRRRAAPNRGPPSTDSPASGPPGFSGADTLAGEFPQGKECPAGPGGIETDTDE